MPGQKGQRQRGAQGIDGDQSEHGTGTPDDSVLGDIANRADIEALLWAFYGAALVDPVLGPVFTIAETDLATHLPRIASFWEVTLLGTGTYAGRPMQLHRHLAATAGLAALHFERWLVLWRHTLTTLFEGPTATRAVGDAQRMAVGMVRDIEKPRPAEGPSSLATAAELLTG